MIMMYKPNPFCSTVLHSQIHASQAFTIARIHGIAANQLVQLETEHVAFWIVTHAKTQQYISVCCSTSRTNNGIIKILENVSHYFVCHFDTV